MRRSSTDVPKHAVLLLAYGSPDSPDDVEAYFRHIRGGREPSPEAVDDLRRRYVEVGGRTPLTRITSETARGLQAALSDRRVDRDVFFAMKHWHPYIADVVSDMARAGITSALVVALAPHYSRMSIGSYRSAVEQASRATGDVVEFTFVDRWHDEPSFIRMMASLIRDGLARIGNTADSADVAVLFSAHSLPRRIREWGDPYEAELRDSCAAVAARARLDRWHFAWQSASPTGEPWLEPDIGDYLERLASEGVRRVLSVPIGFVADHLEVLYDIDREAAAKARALGMGLTRTVMPNASPELVAVLADVVVAALDAQAQRQAVGGAA